MQKRIAAYAMLSGIAAFTLGCNDELAAPPTRVAPSKPSFGASAPFNNAGRCLGNDASTWFSFVTGLDTLATPNDLACTDSAVVVTSATATEISLDGINWAPLGPGGITCTEGDPIFLRMTAIVTDNVPASDRDDIGLWVATDGGNGKDGSCNHYNLPVSPLLPGTFDHDGDSCGDMSQGATTVDLSEVATVCHTGPSGKIEIGVCTAWALATDQRNCPVATLSGPDGYRAGTLPGNANECSCRSIVIQTTAPQTGSITIIEDAVPDDPQDFEFTTAGSGLSSFSLDDDADPTLPNIRTFTGLLAGAYTATEQAASGFDLTAVTCTTGGSGDAVTRTATITLAAGASVTCTFQNTKRASVTLNKRENGALPLTRPWAFEMRTGASILAAGGVVANGSANLTTGVVSFACTLNTVCANVGGLASFVPGPYQVCEVGMPAGYTNNITSPPGFTPAGGTPEGGANASECVNVSLAAGQTGVPAGVPTGINNVAPPASGGDITLGTGSFTLANDVLSGSFDIRNSSMGTQQVFLTSLTIVNATFRDGSTLVQATVTGCVFTPLPVLIPGNASRTITLTGCHVAPSVRKELMFTVRATINSGNQLFYDRVYKVRTQ